MRRALAISISLLLLIPLPAIAKEDAKSEKKSNSNSASVAKDSNSNASKNPPTSTSTNPSANTPSNPSTNTSTTPSPSNPANTKGNEKSADKKEAVGNAANPANPGKDVNPEKPDNSNKSDRTNKKELTLAEGETKEFLVKFRDDASIASEATSLRGQKARVSRTFNNVFKGLSATLNSKQLEALKKNPRVELIEEDAQVRTTQIQEGAPWGIDRIDQRNLPLDGRFTYASTGSGVRGYVVDTGIRATHQEFTGRVLSGFTAIADGQGTNDCNGHGTHVAGTIAGSTYGVAKSVSIVPVRVLGCDGSGTLSGVVAGLDWIAANHPSGTPAVANMSLGAGASATLDSAVNNLISRGVTVVVAAGNSTASACDFSPARVPAAITVAASTSNDQLASYSNYGSCVDIIAPGSAITSAWFSSDLATASLNGTSMASPHVAGAAATLLSNGAISPSNLDAQLKSLATNDSFAALPSGTPNRLLFTNPQDVVVTPAPVLTTPSAPSNVVAEPAKRSALLTWQRPADDGGTAIISQTISVITAGNTVKTITVSGTAVAATVRSLNSRLSYSFTVAAINAIGQGPSSAPSNVITPLR